MSLRSSLTKLVGSLPSLRIRPTWAGAAGVVGFLAVSASGCNCGNSSLVPCGDAGEFCVCTGYGCQPAESGSGGSGGAGTGGQSGSTTVGTGGTGGVSSDTGGSDGGTGGSTVGELSCDTKKPCPAPQVCLPDGFCHYPCTDLLDCKHFDNRFVSCTDGFCDP